MDGLLTAILGGAYALGVLVIGQRVGPASTQQVDLHALTAELLAVVDHTMQPTGESLWPRPHEGVTASGSSGELVTGDLRRPASRYPAVGLPWDHRTCSNPISGVGHGVLDP